MLHSVCLNANNRLLLLFFFLSAIVVFDGVRLDNKKMSTALSRSQRRVDFSTKISVNVELNPLLLRQTFIHVLEQFNIPYVSALGEGDDECVSLANHLDCYVIACDSDYYCYNLYQGYIPFRYLDINPIKNENSQYYLSTYLFTLDKLLDRFHGLNSSTLALACALCGNDYINAKHVQPIVDFIITTIDKSHGKRTKKSIQTKHWYIMTWLARFHDIDTAFEHIDRIFNDERKMALVNSQLRLAMQSYIKPSDTLIYRFVLTNNRNLRKNAYFLSIAKQYLDLFNQVIYDEFDAFICFCFMNIGVFVL
jgi:5'-3' exonuclease